MRARLLTVVLLALLTAACGDDQGITTDGEDGGGEFVSSLSCEGLADRWADIQQQYLDRLGDADNDDLAGPTPEVVAAGLWVGNAMLEQVRDSNSAGCSEQLTTGGEALCSRVDRLQPGGEAAESVVESIQANCG